jgi:hypothetical protein
MNTIRLFLHRNRWTARFDGPHSYALIWQTGSCDIETLFGPGFSAGKVAEVFREIAPGACIVVGV